MTVGGCPLDREGRELSMGSSAVGSGGVRGAIPRPLAPRMDGAG